MPMRKIADDTATEILTMLDVDQSKHDEVSKIIQNAFITVIENVHTHCVEAVNVCCNPEQDTAHKIAEELKQKQKLLISNLSSLR